MFMSKLLFWLASLTVAAVAGCRPTVAEQLAIHIHSERAMFQVLVSPGRTGTDSFVLQLMSGSGNLLRVKEATLSLSLPERGIEPVARKATLGNDGYWHVGDVPIPHPGRWHVRVDAVTDFQTITLEDDLDVPSG
jgi:copper transport protein